jgi:hypothetical protein
MEPGKKIRVLSICDDQGILQSRELLLKHEGYDVESVSSRQSIEPDRIRTFHVAILCHSLNPNRARRIAEKLRKGNGAIRVLRVQTFHTGLDCVYDRSCDVFPNPSSLLNALAMLSPSKSGENTSQHLKLA